MGVLRPFYRLRWTTVLSQETRQSWWMYFRDPVQLQGESRFSGGSGDGEGGNQIRQILQVGLAGGGDSGGLGEEEVFGGDWKVGFIQGQLIVWFAVVVDYAPGYCSLILFKLITIIQQSRTSMEPTQPTQPQQPTQPTQPTTTKPQQQQQPPAYLIHMHPHPHLHPHPPNHPPPAPTRKPSTQLLPKKQQDTKSVFLQSVDYGATNQQLQAIFQDCGPIVRVTILKEKITNKPKGCAYVEFAEIESVGHAILLSGIKLRNRTIKVLPKRTNIRGMGNSRGNNQYLLNKLMNSMGPRGGRPG